jgi:hypothetical protein
MSLKGKVVLFLVMALLGLAVVSFGNYFFNARTNEAESLGVGVMETVEQNQAARVAERSFLQEGKPEQSRQVEELLGQSLQRINGLAGRASNEGMRVQIESLSKELDQYRQIFAQAKDNVSQVFRLRAQMLETGNKLAETNRVHIADRITQLDGEKRMEGETLPAAFIDFQIEAKNLAAQMDRLMLNSQGLYLSNNENAYLAEAEVVRKSSQLHKGNATALLPQLKDKAIAAAWEEISRLTTPLQEMAEKLHQLWKANSELLARLDQASLVLAEHGRKAKAHSRQSLESNERSALILGLGVSLLATIFLLAWGFYLIRDRKSVV